MPDSDELKRIGLKATGPRLRILELFQRGPDRHLSAEDVHRLLREDSADVALGTVYRVLAQFEQAGLLKRSHFEADRAVFELDEGGHHDHLVCMDCGRVEEFFDEEIERRQHEIAAARGFQLRDHALSLHGHCVREACPHRPVQGKPAG